MPYFYVPPENVRGGRFFLEKDESKHLSSVLRKKAGEKVRLFDGEGRVYEAILENMNRERVDGKIVSKEHSSPLPYTLRLYQGLPKGDKFDWILEKGTELGVSEFIPLNTERSVTKIPAQKVADRVSRWNKIVLAAAKQSGRSHVPVVSEPKDLAHVFEKIEKGSQTLTLIPWESESKTSLKEALRRNLAPSLPHSSALSDVNEGGRKAVNLIIGPEGGFTPDEVGLAQKRGAVPVTFGPSILRTETAGIFVASILLYELA